MSPCRHFIWRLASAVFYCRVSARCYRTYTPWHVCSATTSIIHSGMCAVLPLLFHSSIAGKLVASDRNHNSGGDIANTAKYSFHNTATQLRIFLLFPFFTGLIGECTTLCGKLPQKLEQEVCDAACVGLGLDEFIHVLERTDIDPIYYCELVRLCKIVDCQGQCLAITSLGVKPPQVRTRRIST